jgi:hypothetical protein
MKVKSSRWYFFFPGNVYAYGPTTQRFTTERAVRKHIRECWGLKRLPRGFAYWRA